MLNYLLTSIQACFPSKKIDCFGKNSLILSTIPYYLLAFICLLVYFGSMNCYFAIFLVYGVIPLLDQFFSLDERNPNQQQRQQLQKNDFLFKLALYATVAIDWMLFFKIMKLFAGFEWGISNCFNLFGVLFLFSNLNSVQFAISHQIFHKQGLFYKILGTLHMSKLLYTHFTYEHLWGHHKRVATPEDPASALKGDSLYRFFPKTFFGSYRSVYQMQKKAGKQIFMNCAVLSVLAALLFTLGVYYFTNLQGTIFFLISALGAIFYLQAINYIQHYGLSRDKLPNGEYEKVNIRHSWNAPHRFSNYLLFKLQRHSDHHENSLKPYQTLVSMQESPHLPHGYSLIIMMSFFPSVWSKVMDPIVEQYRRVKHGKIESQVMLKSVIQTRKFIIEITLGSALLFVTSLLI